MPQRVPSFRPPRVRTHRRPAEQTRPNAYQRGYVDSRHFAWRKAVLLRDNWQCQACGRVCGKKREAHADHIVPVSERPDLRYELTNGQCLCVSCHSRKTATHG